MNTGDLLILQSGQDYKIDPRCYYSREHLWMRLEDNLVLVGVSDLLRAQVGGGHIVDVKPVGTTLTRGDEIAGWDISKAVMMLPTPLSGTIVEANQSLATRPDLGCVDPYGAGWIAKLTPSHWDAEYVYLLTADKYLAVYSQSSMM